MKKPLLITGIVIGVVLALGPLWGMLGTILGMNHAFDVLAGNGVSDPRALSGAIGNTLFATVAGVVACPVGVVILTICTVFLIKLNKQPPPLPTPQN